MDSVAVANKTGPEYSGTTAQNELAARAFDFFKRQGMMYAADAPILITVDKLVSALSRHYAGVAAEKLSAQIIAALEASPSVFRRQDEGDKVSFVTTKSGQLIVRQKDERHMFRQRLNVTANEVSAQDSRAMTDGWLASAQARSDNFSVFQEPAAEAALGRGDISSSVAPSSPYTLPSRTSRSPADRQEPPLDLRRFMHPQTPADQSSFLTGANIDIPALRPAIDLPSLPVEIEPDEIEEETEIEEVAAPVAEVAPVEVAPAPAPVVVPEPVIEKPAPVAVAPPPVIEKPAPVAEKPAPVVPVAPVAPPVPQRRSVIYGFNTPAGRQTLDTANSLDATIAEHGPALREMMQQALREDFRFVSFGDEWFPEEGVERFSKGDFRRIKEYLVETQEALSDRAFMSDVLNRRETDPDYERLRFSLNYRMLKEKKDFEFVGIGDARLWVVAGQSPVSAPKRKPSELGQDFRYLEDATIRALEPEVAAGQTRMDYVLSYYAYENGILPYDARAKSIMPSALLDDQRAALLRVEVPLLFQSFPVELRYPTGNRGGYVVGFDGFFQENLVPGARFSLEPTDQANVLVLRFERTGAQEANMLQIDERRNRYVFRPVSYYAETNPTWMLSDTRYPKLEGTKRLDDAERRKAESVVAQAFEIAGETDEGRLYAAIDDLLPIANIERPMSIGAVRAVLENSNSAFEADPSVPGAYFYDPSKK